MAVALARQSMNTVVVPQIKIYFRKYPSTSQGGTDGAIANVNFTIRSGGTEVPGVTTNEGAAIVSLPAGQTAQLVIFDTTYEISSHGALEANTTLQGVKRRLNMLGYRAGPVNATVDKRSDFALLDFQADQSLTVQGFTTAGAVPTDTQNQARTAVGE